MSTPRHLAHLSASRASYRDWLHRDTPTSHRHCARGEDCPAAEGAPLSVPGATLVAPPTPRSAR